MKQLVWLELPKEVEHVGCRDKVYINTIHYAEGKIPTIKLADGREIPISVTCGE